MSHGGQGAPNILSVACIAYVRTGLRPASVTLTRQIGSDKLISFTGDLGDLRIQGDPCFTFYARPLVSIPRNPRLDPFPASMHPNAIFQPANDRKYNFNLLILIELHDGNR